MVTKLIGAHTSCNCTGTPQLERSVLQRRGQAAIE
jgi:hypothetical protein